MALGFVKSTVELLTCGRGITLVHGFHQLTCQLLYRLALMLVFGLCVWKWTSSVTTLDPNQDWTLTFHLVRSLTCEIKEYQQKIRSPEIKTAYFYNLFFLLTLLFFSSPEPRAHGELIVYQSSRRPSVRASVRLFTLSNMIISTTSRPIPTKFYLKHHWGGGKAALGFWPDRIGTLVSMETDSSHWVIMGKISLAL